MFKTKWLQQALNYAMCLLVFVIPMPFMFAAGAVIIISFLWLLQFNIKTTWQNLVTRKTLWAWLLFFILHAISYTYSHNKEQSLFDLQTKLSFVIFPIIIGAGTPITDRILKNVLLSFIAGVSVIAAFCIGKAIYIFQNTGHTTQFFYHQLVHGLDANAVYQSWYTIFSISALLFYPWQKRWKILRGLIAVFQILFLILLSSKTLLIVFFIFIVPYYIIRTANKRSSYIRAAMLLCIAISGLVFLFKTDNPIKKRYEEIIKEPIILSKANQPFSGSYNNLTVRLFLWQSGIENIKENNLWWNGSGNGDAQDLQNKKYAERGIENIYNVKDRSPLYNINLHNMYLESLVMLGIPGLVFLLIIVFQPFLFIKIKEFKYFYLLFYFVSSIFLMQEAAFQTQAGIIYYTFFYNLLLANFYFKKDKTEAMVVKKL